MPLFTFPEDIRKEWKHKHRLGVQRSRRVKRAKQDARPRDLKDRKFDKALDAAIDRDRD